MSESHDVMSAPSIVGERTGSSEAGLHKPFHWPFGRVAVDEFTDNVASPLHKVSPLMGNAYNNGLQLRTILGNGYFFLLIVSGLLGAAAVMDTHGLAIPPVLWLTILLMVIGILDAFSGMVAWIVFTLGVVFTGHLFSAHLIYGPPGTQSVLYAFTGLLSMAFLWFIGPQLPRRIRLLGFRSIKDRLQRRYVMVADFFVVSLLMILILGSLPIFVPIFTGAFPQSLTQVTIQDHTFIIKICVTIAAVFRVGLDEIVHMKFEPLAKSVGRERGIVGRWMVRLIGAFIALILIWELLGTIWQWPVAWALLMSLELLSAFGERFIPPNSIYRFVPRNLFRIVVLLLFVEYAAKVLAGKLVTGSELIGWLVLVLAIAIAIFAIFDGVEDEEAGDRPATWWTRLIGMIVVVLLFMISQGFWGIEATPYSNPSAVAVDVHGNVFIADSGNNRVIEVPVTGERMSIGADLSNPSGVAPDPKSGGQSIYVADTGNNRVLRVTLQPHQALGALQGSGRYAFADAATTQTSVGHGFSHPTGLATDPQGRLFVCDTNNNRIVEIQPDGTQFDVVTSVLGPLAVSADAFGNLYVASSTSGDVVRYTIGKDGHASAPKVLATELSRPAGVAADAQGNVYVSNTGEDKVIEYQANGQHHDVKGEFKEPRGLAVDGAGHLYIANASEGKVVLSEPVYTAKTDLVGPVAVATAAALGPDGSLWTVSQSAGTVERVNTTSSVVISRGLAQPIGVAWSALGKLYVAQYGNGTVEQVDPNTGVATLVASGLTGISGLAADSYGGLFAIETSSGNLLSISAQGQVKVLVRGLDHPTSVTQDAYGNLDLTLRGSKANEGALWRIVFGGKAQILATGLSDPSGATADFNGNIFFIEHGTHRVWESRGLLGSQIVYEGHDDSTNPSAVVSNAAGNLNVFPTIPGRTITITLSTTDYFV